MGDELFDKILKHPWQFAVVILSSTIALLMLARAFQDFSNHLNKIFKMLFKELAGKSPAQRAGIWNVSLLILLATLMFLAISPSLLAQIGFPDGDSTSGYSLIMVIMFCGTGIWSGHFIIHHEKEEKGMSGMNQSPPPPTLPTATTTSNPPDSTTESQVDST